MLYTSYSLNVDVALTFNIFCVYRNHQDFSSGAERQRAARPERPTREAGLLGRMQPAPSHQLWGLRERCKLPSKVQGGTKLPSHVAVSCMLIIRDNLSWVFAGPWSEHSPVGVLTATHLLDTPPVSTITSLRQNDTHGCWAIQYTMPGKTTNLRQLYSVQLKAMTSSGLRTDQIFTD